MELRGLQNKPCSHSSGPEKRKIDTKIFNSSNIWTVLSIILRLAARPLALVNVAFFVPDDELVADDVMLGLPLLQLHGINTKAMLEEYRDILDKTDCSTIPTLSTRKFGKVARLMLARLNFKQNETHLRPIDSSCTRDNYYKTKNE